MTREEQQQVFEQWMESHRGIFYKVIRSFAKSILDQEDLFQDITLQIWKSIPNFRRQSQVSTWIYRIALNQAIKWSARQPHPTQNIADVEMEMMDSPEEPDRRLDWLYAKIHGLNEIDRSICLLLLEGYSYQEMAELVGISESYIGVKINRIKKYLIQQTISN